MSLRYCPQHHDWPNPNLNHLARSLVENGTGEVARCVGDPQGAKVQR
jgi:hypothetical protein